MRNSEAALFQPPQLTSDFSGMNSGAPKGRTLLEIKIEPIDTRDRAVVYPSE